MARGDGWFDDRQLIFWVGKHFLPLGAVCKENPEKETKKNTDRDEGQAHVHHLEAMAQRAAPLRSDGPKSGPHEVAVLEAEQRRGVVVEGVADIYRRRELGVHLRRQPPTCPARPRHRDFARESPPNLEQIYKK